MITEATSDASATHRTTSRKVCQSQISASVDIRELRGEQVLAPVSGA